MRGRSQSHLVEAADNNFYVAKFTNNPKGNRTLVNGWVGQHIYDVCGVCVPPMRILRLDESVVAASQDLLFHSDRKANIQPGLHLGSMCPADPSSTSIFDFMPRKLLSGVINLKDFAKALVLDTFLGQNTPRQALFVRDGLSGQKRALRAYMVDHTEIFSGTDWLLNDQTTLPFSTVEPFYFLVDSNAACEDAISMVDKFTDNYFYALLSQLPNEWLSPHDWQDYDFLVQTLMRRKEQVRSLVLDRLKTFSIQKVPRGHLMATRDTLVAKTGSIPSLQLGLSSVQSGHGR